MSTRFLDKKPDEKYGFMAQPFSAGAESLRQLLTRHSPSVPASWLALAVMLACGTSQFTWAVLGNLTCFGVALVLHLLAILWQSACMEDQGGVHQQSEGGVVERPS